MPSKAGKKRTKEQREIDLEKLARLRIQGGMNQPQLAQKLGVCQQQISYDLKELRKRWSKRTDAKSRELLAEEIAKWDEVERNHWNDYHLSRRGVDNAQVSGDPRHLQGVERCIAKRAELMGIMPPSKIAPTTPDGKEQYSGVLVVPGLQSAEQWLANDDSPEDDPA